MRRRSRRRRIRPREHRDRRRPRPAGARGACRPRRPPDERRDRRPAVHLGPHGREPRLVAAAQDRRRGPPRLAAGPAAERRPTRAAPVAGRRSRPSSAAPPSRPRWPRRSASTASSRRSDPGGVGKTRLAFRSRPTCDGYPDGVLVRRPRAGHRPGAIAPRSPRRSGSASSTAARPADGARAWLSDRTTAAGARQLRAPARRRRRALLERLLAPARPHRARDQPRPAAGAVRAGLPGPRPLRDGAGRRRGRALHGAGGGRARGWTRRIDRRIAAICPRLDGLALAIELAAARLPSSGSTVSRPASPTASTCSTGGSRIDDRHRSLRSALDWSLAPRT